MARRREDLMFRSWGWMLFAHAKVLRAIETDLLEQHDLPVTWFDVLNRLREAPGRRLRMRELERPSLFTRSGMTRLVDRIEAAGFVRRERSPEDRRGVYVAITPEGNDKVDRVWPDHIASVARHFGANLGVEDAAAIEAACRRILAGDAVPTAVPGKLL
jgi:DNA-binding MarR family transcriptional regulator